MKALIILFVYLTAALHGYAQAEVERADNYLFDQVLITGKTNVNQVQLHYSENSLHEILGSDGENYLRIAIPAGKIQAESKMMLSDFLKMINARDYPAITIILDEDLAGKAALSSSSLHRIGLMLNGTTNYYQVRLNSHEYFSGQWFISGELKMHLSSFDIEPPRKFFGMVRLEDEVLINFKILFASTNRKNKN